MVYEAPEYHPAFEEYCETIFELGEDGLDVIQARIAERLEVSRPAVSEMIRKMAREGLVEVTDNMRCSSALTGWHSPIRSCVVTDLPSDSSPTSWG